MPPRYAKLEATSRQTKTPGESAMAPTARPKHGIAAIAVKAFRQTHELSEREQTMHAKSLKED
ncbi:MAG: hypothetical protein U0744_11125 [Gemmataceae bacterium]